MSDDTLAGLMERFERYMAMAFKVCLPGVVVQYDHTQQRAQVRVGVRERYRDGRQDPSPVISNVPIIFPRSGGASFTMPVVRGDTVLVLFADRSIETWLDTASGEADSNDWRRHDINDAIAIPGLLPFARGSLSENNSDVLMTYAGSRVRLTGGGDVEIETGGQVTVTAGGSATVTAADCTINCDTTINGQTSVNGPLVTIGGGGTASFSGDVTVQGTITATGDVIGAGISLEAHVHGGVVAGGDTTDVPQ